MGQYKFQEGFNIKKFLLIVAVLLLIVYGFFNARNMLTGPTLDILNPTNLVETEQNILTVKGIVKNATFISLNEKPIFINQDGIFEEKLLLSPGSNIIQIKARDRFKKEIVKKMTIYYKESTTTNPQI